MSKLLPRARLGDVLRGRAALVGSRLDPAARRGWVSPVECRVFMGLACEDLHAEERRRLARRAVHRDVGVLLRTALTRLLAPRRDARREARPFIVSTRVDNVTVQQAVELILAPPPGERARLVHFVHPHALNLARFNPVLSTDLARADVVLPDGVGLRVAACILGQALQHNINGTDLLPLLCEAAVARGIPLALVGGAPGVTAECATKLRDKHPDLRLGPVTHGYLGKEETAALVEELRRAPGTVVLLGMGTPLQERWARAHLGDVPGLVVVTVGGLFDFVAGRVPRAPMVWRELGMEWAWRLLQEPRRMAGRYLLGNPLFLSLALVQKLRGVPRRLLGRLPAGESAPEGSA